jgi:superfamily II DNA/RNA helicase
MMQNFLALDALIPGLSQVLTSALNYTDLSPIQKLICNHLKTDRSTNLIAKAKNGSGKSLALSIALLAIIEATD